MLPVQPRAFAMRSQQVQDKSGVTVVAERRAEMVSWLRFENARVIFTWIVPAWQRVKRRTAQQQ
jgi:hypothetical protein